LPLPHALKKQTKLGGFLELIDPVHNKAVTLYFSFVIYFTSPHFQMINFLIGEDCPCCLVPTEKEISKNETLSHEKRGKHARAILKIFPRRFSAIYL